MSFKPEVSTDGGQTFNQNALAFATEAEALASAKDLFQPLAILHGLPRRGERRAGELHAQGRRAGERRGSCW